MNELENNPVGRYRASGKTVPEPKASRAALIVFLLSLIITSFSLGHGTPSGMVGNAAVGVCIGLALYVLLDLQRGIWNILRLDNVALLSLYALLFLEFLFPQPRFDEWRTPEDTLPAIRLCLFAIGAFVVGNQLRLKAPLELMRHVSRPVSPRDLWLLFCLSLFGAYLYKLMSVHFNPVEMIRYFFENRWNRPWGRGKFGDWRALLSELVLLSYIIPPLGGVLFAKARYFTKWQLGAVAAGVGLVLLDGFCAGTRNVFAAYGISMLLAWSYFQFIAKRYTRMFAVWAAALVVMYVASNAMLAFRNMGLKYYLAQKGSFKEAMLEPSQEETIFVDYNLNTVCELMHVFPEQHAYLGWEIPYNGLIRPVPRALFPWKPEGLSLSIEEACGVSGMTLSCTYIGEAYISGGWFGVGLYSVLLGMFARWGTQFIALRHSDYGIMLFASLAFALAICMRSFMTFSTMLMPSVALFAYAKFRSIYPVK